MLLGKLTDIAVENSKPDMVILLDLSPKVGLARKIDQNEVNRLDAESLEFHTRVRSGYLDMAGKAPDLWKVTDATRSVEEIHQDIVSVVLNALDK